MEPLLERKITRESIGACIDGLIRKYRDLPEADRAKLSEQDVRDYFVTPLLEALGWGTVDPRERAAEKYLPRRGFSDYELCLPIGASQRDRYVPVIYVEAKKFGELSPLQRDLFGYERRSEADDQVIEYADQYNPKRSEKIGWAILTNFEIFRLWDTRRGVLVESTEWFSELKRDRTLEILFLLSRDQVAQDPVLTSLSSYRALPEIDEKFLSKLNEWRESMAFAIWNHRPNRPQLGRTLAEQRRNLRDVVQRTLDRLIVIRTAEDRGLLPPQLRLQEMVKNFGGENAVPLMLLKNIQNNTFRYFDHHYNSKLFGPHLSDQMEVHNSPLRAVIEEMCKAGFASMNADILGTTYEQYLGQTVEIDSKADSPRLVPNIETRTAQGIYYTPRHVVQYIVDRTLGRYLYGTENGQLQGKLLPGERRKNITDIRDLSVLDPACGSGSFLIYAFDVLYGFYSAEKKRLEQEIESRLEATIRTGIPRLAAEATHDPEILGLRSQLELTRFARARIIERHLYGVDLDPQAAEVASMNLLLKALTRNERLPRILGDNIKVGNSLISGVGPDDRLKPFAYEMTQLVNLRKEIHRATLQASEHGTNREAIEKGIEELEQEFRSLADSLNRKLNESLTKGEDRGWFDEPESKRPFNWQVEFPELFPVNEGQRRGFSIVIGNPPYVGFHGFAHDKPFLRGTYLTASGKFDIYAPFIERGIALTTEGGELSFICPSTFMKRGFGRKLRRYLLIHTSVESIHDFLHRKVFRDALNYTCIVVFRRSAPSKTHQIIHSEGSVGGIRRSFPQSKLGESPWVFRFGREAELVDRLKASASFKELGSAELTQGISEGIVTGNNSVLLIEEDEVHRFQLESEFLRKCVRGEDVKRYCLDWGRHYLIYPYRLRKGRMEVVAEDQLRRCPNLYAYLLERKTELESRTYLMKGKKHWYEIWCPRDIRQQASGKIVVPELADRSQFSWVSKEFFYVDTTCGISLSEGCPVDPWYLLAVLNSKPAEYLYRKTTVPKASGFLIYKTMFLSRLPIPIPQTAQQKAAELKISELAKKVQSYNALLLELDKSFDECLRASLPMMNPNQQSFYCDYYPVAQYWKNRRLIPSDALDLAEPVAGITVQNNIAIAAAGSGPTQGLVVCYQSEKGGRWKPLVEVEPVSPDLRLFILLAARRFTAESARKRKWKLPGAKASRGTVNVVLKSLVIPVWGLLQSSSNPIETNLRKISELIAELKRRMQGEIDPSVLEVQRDNLDQEIDDIVFELYGFSADERKLVWDSIPR